MSELLLRVLIIWTCYVKIKVDICIYLTSNSLHLPMVRYWRKIVGLFWLEIEPQAVGPENQRTQS